MDNDFDIINVRKLEKLLKCEKAYEISEKNISGVYSKRYEFLMKSLKCLCECLHEGEMASYEKIMDRLAPMFDREYSEEWFHCRAEYNALKDKDFRRFRRLAYFLEESGYVICKKDVCLTATLPTRIRGYVFKSYSVRIDAVAKRNGCKEAVIFSTEKPEYNNRARKKESRPSSCLELVAAACACIENNIAIDTVRVLSISDRNKDSQDETEQEYSLYDNSYSIDVGDKGVGWDKKLAELISSTGVKKDKCEGCIYRDMCVSKYEPVTSKEKAVKTDGHFTAAQREIIGFKDGIMRVIAVPGAGKTCSLVERMASLVHSGVPSERILFVAFANKAALEIEQRCIKRLDTPKIPEVMTFNALGMKILAENAGHLGRNVRLASKLEQAEILMEIFNRETDDFLPQKSFENMLGEYGIIPQMIKFIDRIDRKGKELFTAEYNKEGKAGLKDILYIYDKYKEAYRAADYISYDEQISLAVRLLQDNSGILEKYALKWDYIMVDEFQDASDNDAGLLYMLANAGKGNLVCVGDLDQSIYEFRAPRCYRHLYEMPILFKNCRTVMMHDNFRTCEGIAHACNELISNNAARLSGGMNAHIEGGAVPVFKGKFHMYELPNIIQSYIEKGYSYGDIGVFGRQNRTLFDAAKALSDEGILSQSPKSYLRNEPVFWLIYDTLNIYLNGFDGTDVSLYRIFAVLGKESLLPKKRASETLYQKMCRDGSIEPINFDSIMDCIPYQCGGTYTGQMEIMKRIFDALYFLKYSYYADMGVLIKALTGTLLGEDGGYALGSLSKKIRNARINTVQELYGLMSKMAEYRDDTKSDWEPCADKVNLLTVHESKGLEFPVVIILNSEEFQKDEEERKLFFVGMTRARWELLIAESEYKRFEMFDEIASSCRLVDAAYEIK